MLAMDEWRANVEVAPLTFTAGQFTLTSTDWSGKAEGGRVMASGYALGVDSKGDDKEAGGFQPGEFWSFRFDSPGRLMGIHFDGFSIEDADKALLYIGDAEPIVVDPERVQVGFWRPDRLLEFNVGQTLRLVAAEPSADDLQRAENAYMQRLANLAVNAAAAEPDWNASSQWRVSGLNVIGLTDQTRGGYINFANVEPKAQAGVSAAILPERNRPAPRPANFSSGDTSTQIGISASLDPDAVLQDFKVYDKDASQFKITYQVNNGSLPVSSFNIRLYPSANGTTPNGAALAAYNITNVSPGTRDVIVDVVLGNDVQENYYLLARIEDAADVPTTNNTKEFFGGAFRDDTTGIAYYHAAKSLTSDWIRITAANPRDIERYQNGKYESIYQHPNHFTFPSDPHAQRE
jgi:hypothetical protein